MYAVGEIVLVVVGIFIGLQVNKLNDQKIKKDKINQYYSRINEEVTTAIQLIQYNNQYSDSLIDGLVYNLNIIDRNGVDSLFITNMKFLTDNEQQTFYFPIIDEFLDQGYLSSIEDIKLREQFQLLSYYRKQSDVDDSNVNAFNYNILLPELMDKLNYLEIDFTNHNLSSLGFEKLQYENDLVNDYEALSKDPAIRNLMVYRLNIEKNRLINNTGIEFILKKIKKGTETKGVRKK
jgi:hypothetical protein